MDKHTHTHTHDLQKEFIQIAKIIYIYPEFPATMQLHYIQSDTFNYLISFGITVSMPAHRSLTMSDMEINKTQGIWKQEKQPKPNKEGL